MCIRDRFDAALKKWRQKKKEIIAATPEGKKPKLSRKPRLQGPPRLDTSYPGSIFNQKIAPWTRYAIAGTIWYQGEANVGRSVQYEGLLTAMIEDWRERWNSEFPFFIVQLANFRAPTTDPGAVSNWAELQSMQTKVSQTVPNCGVAVINEIGLAGNIHPLNKKDVGYRLSLLALKQHYKNCLLYTSPSPRDATLSRMPSSA